MKIAFFGTPQFAAENLKALIADPEIEIVAVFSQPDKKIGRKQELKAPAVKEVALQYNIPVFQPETREELLEQSLKIDADFFVVIAYGMIMDQKTLDQPKIAAINVHASILPKYRGASPIQAAILNGDKKTGITIMKMVAKLDAGPSYQIDELNIDSSDNFETLSAKLEELSSKALPVALKKINKETTPTPQNNKEATYCGKISKEDGEIDWNKSSQEIINQIRAYTPWPGAFTKIEGKTLKILKAHIGEECPQPIGHLTISKNTLKFTTRDKYIHPEEVQLEGKRAMNTQEFLNGYKDAETS
jgi:methionyl-tRNA formyltransferase